MIVPGAMLPGPVIPARAIARSRMRRRSGPGSRAPAQGLMPRHDTARTRAEREAGTKRWSCDRATWARMAHEGIATTADGARLWYTWTGTGPPAVLCHGGPGLWDYLGPLAALVEDRVSVLRYDQRGAGRSDAVGPFTVDRSVADLEELRSQFGPERWIVGGHSWGASLALKLHAGTPRADARRRVCVGRRHRPGLERRLPRGSRSAADPAAAAPARSAARARRAATRPRKRSTASSAGRPTSRTAPGRPSSRRPLRPSRTRSTARRTPRSSPRSARGTSPRWSHGCATLALPVLVVHGMLDPRPHWAVDTLVDALPNVVVHKLDGAGHNPWLEQPAAVREILIDFVASLDCRTLRACLTPRRARRRSPSPRPKARARAPSPCPGLRGCRSAPSRWRRSDSNLRRPTSTARTATCTTTSRADGIWPGVTSTIPRSRPRSTARATHSSGTRCSRSRSCPRCSVACTCCLARFLAREFGGRRFAQLLAATVGAVGPLYLTTSHFLGTVSPDLVLWAIASWLVVRMIRRDDPRLWIAIGAVCGIGLLNKHTMLFWIAAAGFGLLTSGQRHLFASRWLALGVAISLVIWAPNLVWEARHHWATLEFFRHLRENNGGEDVAQFVPLQFGIVTIAGTVVVFVALRALARDHALRSAWFLLDGYVFAFVVLFALQGKAYYLGSWYLPLIGLGAAVVEARWTRRSARVLLAAVLVTGLSAAPIFTPILPEATAVNLGFDDLNGDLGAMLGWPHFVRRIAGVYRALPASEQRDAVVLTGNYSQAGAIEYYGRSLGLPHPISGHNTYWWWGYGDPRPDAVVIAVGVWRGALTPYFRSVTKVTDFASESVPIDPQERDTVVYVCRDLRVLVADVLGPPAPLRLNRATRPRPRVQGEDTSAPWRKATTRVSHACGCVAARGCARCRAAPTVRRWRARPRPGTGLPRAPACPR